MVSPEIFGIAGMALVFVGFTYVIQEAGLSSTIIQKPKINHTIVATTFSLNIILSIILVIVIYLSASSIAAFYQQPEVEILLNYAGIGVFVGSLGITQRALLTRERKFKILTKVDLIAELVTSVVSVLLAVLNYPLLAISLSMLFRPAVQSLCLILVTAKRRIIGKPNFKILREILPYSSNVLGVRVVNFIRNHVDYLLIGKLLGSASLGIYTIAFQWSTVARFYFSQSIAKVAFPEVSRNQHDIDKVREIYLNLVRKISFVTFPFCLGLVLVASEFIHVFYGEKWMETVPALQILMIAGMISSIGTIVGAFFKGLGRPDIELKLNIFSLISFTILIYIGSFYGIIGVAVAVLINTITFNTFMTLKICSHLNLKLKVYVESLYSSGLSVFIMVAIVYLTRVNFMNDSSSLISLVILSLTGVFVYSISSYYFNKDMMKWIMQKLDKISYLKWRKQ